MSSAMILILALAFWALAWTLNVVAANGPLRRSRAVRVLVPVLFGATLLVMWEAICRAGLVEPVVLPAPSAIAAKIAASPEILWADFVQTVLKGALSGFLIGTGAAMVVAVICDRVPFLRAGLLPVGNFVAALPIIGLAPILVTWFGFGWQSKAAVVVAMVFFPMLVNVVAGLASAERMQRDLMATWGASYAQSLWKLRLPAAMPFVFNGLKIAASLALIGAIVAEYFGSPVFGMGFRISTAAGVMNLELVWAEIAVAALAGSAFYGLIALIEAGVTFWHPSQRN